jgi:hypothetical protein
LAHIKVMHSVLALKLGVAVGKTGGDDILGPSHGWQLPQVSDVVLGRQATGDSEFCATVLTTIAFRSRDSRAQTIGGYSRESFFARVICQGVSAKLSKLCRRT